MKKKIITLISVFLLLFSPTLCFAKINDGFSTHKKINGRYFKIYTERGVDADYLALQIAAPTTLKTSVNDPMIYKTESDLAGELDALYLVVSDIMDIHLKKNFKCTVKVVKNKERLSQIAYTLFGQEMQVGGFYVTSNNTIYVDADNVSIYILGHEMAHAIQVQYFVVPPPVKIQEVLSGYVEYQLRKY